MIICASDLVVSPALPSGPCFGDPVRGVGAFHTFTGTLASVTPRGEAVIRFAGGGSGIASYRTTVRI